MAFIQSANGQWWIERIDNDGIAHWEQYDPNTVDPNLVTLGSPSEVAICNLALSHLGDSAGVTAINPPDASVQAQLCARYYPHARNLLLEMYPWSFATKRVALVAQDTVPDTSAWQYAYTLPTLMLKALSVAPAAEGDGAAYPFSLEAATNGAAILLTDCEDAVLRYTVCVSDPTKYSSLFTTAVSWLLAALLAGPIIKGDAGAAQAQRCLAQFQLFAAQAKAADANQGRPSVTHTPAWIAGR